MASFSVVLSAGDGMDHEVLDSVIASTLEDESRRSLYNLANRGDDELVDRCAEENIAYASFFPLGGFNPLQSDILTHVATRLEATPRETWGFPSEGGTVRLPTARARSIAPGAVALDAAQHVTNVGRPDEHPSNGVADTVSHS